MKPEELKYAKSHEWVHVGSSPEGKVATIGISHFAVEALTDLVYMELPAVGDSVTAGESFGEIESVKAVSDLYSPVSGEIIAVNGDLANHLEILNDDPYEKGWMIKVRPTSETSADLLDYAAYQKLCAEEGH